MSRVFIFGLLALAAVSSATAGTLSNATDSGGDFYDDATGLYWLDPMLFETATRAQVDAFIAANPNWSWATAGQIEAIVGSTAFNGMDFVDILGPCSDSFYGLHPRWVGLYAETDPNAWFIQCLDTSDDVITDAGGVTDLAEIEYGAWLVSAQDPGTQPRLDHLGSTDNPYFHDQSTGLYWCDPVQFVSMDRAAIDAWLVANSDWRWALSTEVSQLVGKLPVGTWTYVGDVMGAPQLENDYILRYTGYCGDLDPADAFSLWRGYTYFFVHQANFLVYSGVESDAAALNPGAWIVSATNPTAIEARSLSEVKRLFD